MAGGGTVIVVGAGPTGLALSAGLALAGVQVRVLGRRSGLRADSRAICLHARSMELPDLRGQAGAFTAAGLPVPSFPFGLKGAVIDFDRLDSDFPHLLDIPQSQIETLLLDRAASLVRACATGGARGPAPGCCAGPAGRLHCLGIG